MSQPLPRPEDRRRDLHEATLASPPYRSEAFFEDLPPPPTERQTLSRPLRLAEPACA
jgi:hypothetical protein